MHEKKVNTEIQKSNNYRHVRGFIIVQLSLALQVLKWFHDSVFFLTVAHLVLFSLDWAPPFPDRFQIWLDKRDYLFE